MLERGRVEFLVRNEGAANGRKSHIASLRSQAARKVDLPVLGPPVRDVLLPAGLDNPAEVEGEVIAFRNAEAATLPQRKEYIQTGI